MSIRVPIIEARKSWKVCELAPYYKALGDSATSPERVLEIMRAIGLHEAVTEEFWVLLLNGQNRLIGLHRVSIGTVGSSLVHPRETFSLAVAGRASSIILCHNHPSGDCTPSPEDIAVTKRLCEAGRILGIPILDHVVIGGSEHPNFISIRTNHRTLFN